MLLGVSETQQTNLEYGTMGLQVPFILTLVSAQAEVFSAHGEQPAADGERCREWGSVATASAAGLLGS